jgi:hypothetical protein
MHILQTQHAEYAKNGGCRQNAGAAGANLMSPPQEIAHTLFNMAIDGAVRLRPSTIAEVTRPTPEEAVELISHFGPRLRVARYQHGVHLLS